MLLPWEAIRPYVKGSFEATGEVERSDCLFWAEPDGYSDDVVDALAALGSRIFRGPDAVALAKDFLLQAGYIVEG